MRDRVRAARGHGGPREWVITAALGEAARSPATRSRAPAHQEQVQGLRGSEHQRERRRSKDCGGWGLANAETAGDRASASTIGRSGICEHFFF